MTGADDATAGPFAGIRVLDLSQNLAGPYCTMMLADLGADVWKVEPPTGDNSRTFQPPRIGDESAAFLQLNRNKRSLVVDINSRTGAALVRTLAARADVFVENFRPGVLDRRGLSASELRAEHDALVYCSISGFGRGSPYGDRAGLDLVAQGMSGIMSITGEVDGPPVKVGVPISDLGAGLFACLGIVTALFNRERTGVGEVVETSLLDAALALSVWEASAYFATGARPRATGTAHRLAAPYEAFPTRDGSVTVGAASQTLWERLCHALGADALLGDPRFATNGDRLENRAELGGLVAELTRRFDTDELASLLVEHGVPCGPILGYDEILEDEHMRARDMVWGDGAHRLLGSAVKLDAGSARLRRPAPRLGEHTLEVLRECGIDDDTIEAAVREGAAVAG